MLPPPPPPHISASSLSLPPSPSLPLSLLTGAVRRRRQRGRRTYAGPESALAVVVVVAVAVAGHDVVVAGAADGHVLPPRRVLLPIARPWPCVPRVCTVITIPLHPPLVFLLLRRCSPSTLLQTYEFGDKFCCFRKKGQKLHKTVYRLLHEDVDASFVHVFIFLKFQRDHMVLRSSVPYLDIFSSITQIGSWLALKKYKWCYCCLLRKSRAKDLASWLPLQQQGMDQRSQIHYTCIQSVTSRTEHGNMFIYELLYCLSPRFKILMPRPCRFPLCIVELSADLCTQMLL